MLQRRLVDMFMEYEQAKSMGTCGPRLDEGYGAVAKKAVSGFKVQMESRALRGPAGHALHTRLGMTELNVGHWPAPDRDRHHHQNVDFP